MANSPLTDAKRFTLNLKNLPKCGAFGATDHGRSAMKPGHQPQNAAREKIKYARQRSVQGRRMGN
jgi:hypothetical protein